TLQIKPPFNPAHDAKLNFADPLPLRVNLRGIAVLRERQNEKTVLKTFRRYPLAGTDKYADIVVPRFAVIFILPHFRAQGIDFGRRIRQQHDGSEAAQVPQGKFTSGASELWLRSSSGKAKPPRLAIRS